MKVKELKEILNSASKYQEDDEIEIVMSGPSIGATKSCGVKNAVFGFDWDMGRFLILPEKSLVEKTQDHQIHESSVSLLMYLATQSLTIKNPSYAQREAKRILLKNGYSEETIMKAVHLYHKKD